jgi:hypothetical protein
MSQSHWDAFLIDCDGVVGSVDVVAGIRNSRANRQSVIFTVVHGTTTVGEATELGANFVLGKPLDPNRLTTYLQVSLPKMEAEHRRYFRYQLTLDAKVVLGDGQMVAVQILNVSQGGLAMRLLDPARLDGPVTIEFDIPGPNPAHIQVKAVATWSIEPKYGMHFVNLDEESRIRYDKWLDSLKLS